MRALSVERMEVADVSAYAFAACGGVLAGAFRRYHGASALGELSSKLCDRFGNRDLLCKVHFLRGSCLTPWARPFAEAKAQLERGCELGRLYGDTEYEAFSAGTLAVIDFCEGLGGSRQGGAARRRAPCLTPGPPDERLLAPCRRRRPMKPSDLLALRDRPWERHRGFLHHATI